MLELHDELECLAARVERAPTFDEVRTRRERRQRRSAHQALAAGLCIAILGTVLAYTALRPDDPATLLPAWTMPTRIVVWPESPMSDETPAQAQAGVDAGEEQWRLDPERVVDRFARTVLGWGDPTIARIAAAAYTLTHDGTVPPLQILVAQPARRGEGGIWSVAQVSHPDLGIDVAESSATFDLTLPSDRRTHVGVVATNGCRDDTAFELGLGSGRFELALPEPEADDPACGDVGAGYVFAYVTDERTVPVGDPLFEAAPIEYPWLTIVPVTLTMEGAPAPSPAVEPAPDVLTITCRGERTAIDRNVVAAGPSGVEIYSKPHTTLARLVFDPRPFKGQWLVAGSGAATLDLAPGTHTVACIYEGDLVSGEETFEVVDPSGYYVAPILTCVRNRIVFADYFGSVRGPTASDATRKVLVVRDGDEVRIAPYPEGDPHRVILVRGREVIAVVNLQRHGDRWAVSSVEACPGALPSK